MKTSSQPTTKSKAKKQPTVAQLQKKAQKLHENGFHNLFSKMGFSQIKTDGIEITFMGRTGEFDAIYIYKNIILVMEYTIANNDITAHILKKKVIYDHITNNCESFVKLCRASYTEFSKSIDPIYQDHMLQVRVIYASKKEPPAEAITSCPNIFFMHGAHSKYFQALVKSIEKSARFEFFKFLNLKFEDIGETCIGSSMSSKLYQGFLLPEGNSSYPEGFKIISFYADPENLISKGYVLRRDGWRDESHLYQRIILPKKIKQMRKYLIDERRVFVNNVIVTLPSETSINNITEQSKNLTPDDLKKVKPVTISIPDGFDLIGIVDGQHRVFCYHEGSDSAEEKISALRRQQNLMVTGLVYPNSMDEVAKRSFEAKLFLEINDNQARARSSLKQDIEVIIRPHSGIAIAKRVAQNLGRSGIYNGLLQSSYFDSPHKIKTSSIVSYGLRPLVKMDGQDSLFAAWGHSDKNNLRNQKEFSQHALLEQYIEFCSERINEFFLAIKLAVSPPSSQWDIEANPRSDLLSPTAINGLISFLRKIIENGHPLSAESHKKKLHNLKDFKFSQYKSSHWQALGQELFDNHYKAN